MTKAEKTATIEDLKERLAQNDYFYLADSSELSVEQINNFRGACFEKGIQVRVVKNTLLKKALEAQPEEKNYTPLFDVLKGPTALLFTETANAPARVIKEFRKEHEKPVLKAAYIETAVYIGDDQVDTLCQLKSKEELLGDIVTLLQSPAKNVLSALKSGGSTIAGLLKALEERGE